MRLRLMWAGVATELHVFPGTCHGFDSLLPDWETSQRLFELQGAACGVRCTSLNWSPRGCNAMARLLPISRHGISCADLRRQLPRDRGVVGVDIGGIDHHEVLVG